MSISPNERANFDTFAKIITKAYGVLFGEIVLLTWYKHYLEQDTLDVYAFIDSLHIPDGKEGQQHGYGLA